MADNSVRGHFLWHELMTGDPQAAVAFYSRVVGWKAAKWEQDPAYTILAYKNVPMAGVMRIPPDAKAMGMPPGWTVFIGTPDVDVTAWDAQRFGGKLLKGPETTPTVGQWAILQDPQGAVFAAYTPERTPKVGADPGLGDFSWHELATKDHAAAFDFYRRLFGWAKTGSMDMGPAGEYLLFGKNKKDWGGIYTKGKDVPGPAAWLPYARVSEVNPTAATIEAARGTIILPPMEVPDGTWITVAKDPQGAVFAVNSMPKKKKKAKPAVKKKAKPAPRKSRKAGKKVTGRTAKAAKRTKTKPAKKTRTAKKARK